MFYLYKIIIENISKYYFDINYSYSTYNKIVCMINIWLFNYSFLYKDGRYIKIKILNKTKYVVNDCGEYFKEDFEINDFKNYISYIINNGYTPIKNIEVNYELFNIMINQSLWNHNKYPLL